MNQWRQAIEEAHGITAEKAGQCAARGRGSYNKKARNADLQPGDTVLIRNFAEMALGNYTLWEDKIYIINNQNRPDSPVYEITPETGTG